MTRKFAKTFRYYAESIDLDLISSGESYTKLRKTYVIFICTFDPFSDGRHIYTFENTCKESPSLLLGDETTKIFLNTKGRLEDVNTEMKEFLTYVENPTDSFASLTSSPLIKEIHKRVIEVKQNKETEVEYMTLFQRDRENMEQGVMLASKIIKLYIKGQHVAEIAKQFDLELEYVQSIITNYEKD